MRLLAMTAGDWNVHLGEARPRLSVQTRDTVMSLRAGLFAIVATDTKRLVDHQHISCFTQPLGHEKTHHRGGLRLYLHARIVGDASTRSSLQKVERRIGSLREHEKVGALEFDQLR